MKLQRWIIRDKQVAKLEEFEFESGNLSPREVVVEVDYSVVSPRTESANYQALAPPSTEKTGGVIILDNPAMPEWAESPLKATQ